MASRPRPPGRRGRRAHEEAVARRLALLGAELESARVIRDPEEESHTRVRVASPAAPTAPAPPLLAPLVPAPGRHLARGRWGAALALGPGQLAVVALLVLAGIGAVAWWLTGGGSAEVVAPPRSADGLVSLSADPTTRPAAGAGTADATGAAGAARSGGTVTVDVAGEVRRPGIAVLDTGSRVVDALRAAGGARAGVDLTGLNLARVLVDGEQILVGVEPPAGVAASLTGAGTPVPALVNINTADQVTLESLPDVGPVTAQAILAWRTEHGGFTSVDQLLDVDGIGEATLAQLAPYVTL